MFNILVGERPAWLLTNSKENYGTNLHFQLPGSEGLHRWQEATHPSTLLGHPLLGAAVEERLHGPADFILQTWNGVDGVLSEGHRSADQLHLWGHLHAQGGILAQGLHAVSERYFYCLHSEICWCLMHYNYFHSFSYIPANRPFHHCDTANNGM